MRDDITIPATISTPYNIALESLTSLNQALAMLRKQSVACNIVEHGGRWYLDAKIIMTQYNPPQSAQSEK